MTIEYRATRRAEAQAARPPLPDFRLESPEGEFLAVSDLVRRGWTRALVRERLGAPCLTAPNPRHRLGRPMRLYGRSRVEAEEADPEVAARIRRTLALRLRREQAALDWEERLAALAGEIEIEVPALEPGALREAALRLVESDRGAASLFPDDGFEIAAVEHLFRLCEPVLWRLDGFYGRRGVRAARRALRRRIFEAIARSHPALAGECARRIAAEQGLP